MQTPTPPTRRWMASLLAEAATCKTRMPWERGLRRQALIARRAAASRTASATIIQPRTRLVAAR